MRSSRTLAQRFADWLRYSVADRIDRDGAPRSAGATFTFESGIGRVWHEGHNGPGCPVWYLSEQDYRRAHHDAPPADDQEDQVVTWGMRAAFALVLIGGAIKILIWAGVLR